ncbi:MAG: chorismate synthase, partial [Promethearchaeota archaeon]
FDEVKILSGIFNGKTTGAPLCLIIENKDVDSSNYEKFKYLLRPSHVDYVILKKYGGHADYRGSGRFSGRITAGFVMAGAVAKQILTKVGINVFAYTKSIGDIKDEFNYNFSDIDKLREIREKSLVRAIDKAKSEKMIKLIEEIKQNKDSIGGTVKCVAIGVPVGIGGPIFNSLDAEIARAIFSIPAVRGIEFGAGFKASIMRGSEHNDPWVIENGKIKTAKNDSGGIIGGISTGMPIEFTVAFKPTPSIGLPQKTVNIQTLKNEQIVIKGRHDPCIVPRAVVIVEAMLAIVLVDRLLIEGKIENIIK